jgi:orotidine-5'-phosphate decarboxylase
VSDTAAAPGGGAGAAASAGAFGTRLAAAMDLHGPLCAGIDPHPALLRDWGLDDSPAGLEVFSMRAVEALAGRVAAVKPQSAFFERHGSAGVAVLERVVAGLAEAGTLSVVDAKRGDIGSTMQAYADAYCGDASPLAGDAVTVSPFLGFGSLRPVLDEAARTGRGVFVLALTSNPDGAQVQHAVGAAGRSVAAAVVEAVAAENARARGVQAPGDSEPGPVGRDPAGPGSDGPGSERLGSVGPGSVQLGSVGLVVGATVGDAVQRLGIDLSAAGGPLLAPGVGAQGASAADLRRVFGDARRAVLAASSREVLAAGPSVASLREAARRTAATCAEALGR